MDILGTKTFVLEKTLKAQAGKILEEASEASEALRRYEEDATVTNLSHAREELADVIQTALNAFVMLGCDKEDIVKEMHACYLRNKERGRVD